MIRTVAFDADETLVDTPAAVTVALEAVVALIGDPALTVAMLREDAAHYWDTIPEQPVRVIRGAAFERSLGRVGRVRDLDRVVDLFFETRYDNTEPYPGVLGVLEQLRPDYKLGYATNGNAWADRCGLAGQFSFELYALHTGVPKKPEVAFYEAVSAEAGCRPEEIVYVGDTYAHDVAGPAAFGMRTVWLNPSGQPVPGEIQPDAVIENLTGLPRILAGWR